ncbi:hypothetical protein [uncultured Tateyamaria sp.]|uniref:hypothetical protein n=1 Tax=uncultured Tateyamaria sp. TaxID=455651 RepID=UPI00262100F3|nr:hypothetical protein [uncultured Tateyamaria sp.]
MDIRRPGRLHSNPNGTCSKWWADNCNDATNIFAAVLWVKINKYHLFAAARRYSGIKNCNDAL